MHQRRKLKQFLIELSHFLMLIPTVIFMFKLCCPNSTLEIEDCLLGSICAERNILIIFELFLKLLVDLKVRLFDSCVSGLTVILVL